MRFFFLRIYKYDETRLKIKFECWKFLSDDLETSEMNYLHKSFIRKKLKVESSIRSCCLGSDSRLNYESDLDENRMTRV